MQRNMLSDPHWIARLLLVVVLLFIVSTLAGCAYTHLQAQQAPTATPRSALPPTEIVPTVTPAATDIPWPTPSPPDTALSLCTFTDPASPASSATPVPYRFSEPTVILTNTGGTITIASWLPDNQRLLLTRSIAGSARETIETVDMRTGLVQRRAERHALPGKPVWVEPQQAIAFVDAIPNEGWMLKMGTAPAYEVAQTNLASPHLVVDPTGQTIGVLLRAKRAAPALVSTMTQTVQQVPVSLPVSPWQHDSTLPLGGEEQYRLTWSPQGNWIVYTSIDGLYLHNIRTDAICRIDLEGTLWALETVWSPDERWLALRVADQGLPVSFVGLRLLNMTTGAIQEIPPPAFDEDRGSFFVTGLAWTPDSRSLLSLVRIQRDERGVGHDGLFLIDVARNTATRVLPDFTFARNLRWSADGQYLAVDCTIWQEGRLCLVNVTPLR
ncbi:hypothetical protein HC928_20350 [bacterium]|nr:hypothetical protein [bacterium]